MKKILQRANRTITYKKRFNITDCYELTLPLKWAEHIVASIPKQRTAADRFNPAPSKVTMKIRIKTLKTNIESEGDFRKRESGSISLQRYKKFLKQLRTSSKNNNDTSAKRQKA